MSETRSPRRNYSIDWAFFSQQQWPTPDYMHLLAEQSTDQLHESPRNSQTDPGMFEISLVKGSNHSRPAGSEQDPCLSKEGKASPPSKPPAQQSAQFSKLHDYAFIFTVCMSQFLSLAGIAQSISPLLIMGKSFGVNDPGTLSWYTAAYSLTVGTFILPAGRLGDMYGHKKMYVFGWAWFSSWSIVAGASVWSGSILFSIARGFQGIGPAILVPNAMALIGRTYPMGLKKNLVFSCFGAGGPTGFVAGAVMAALFAELTWWPWAFWAMAMVCFAMMLISAAIVPADELRPQPPGSTKPKFDYLGAVTGVSGLVLINFAWNQGPVVGWGVPYTYTLLIVGVLFMAAFVFAELRLTQYPLIPLRGLKKEAGYTLACIAAGWASHGIWIYYIFWFLGLLRGFTPLAQSAQTCPVAITGVIFAFLSGILMTRTRPAYVMLLAMLFFLAGSVLIATAPVEQTYWIQTFLSILIMPGGMNLSFPAGTILLSGALPKENQGIAASLVSVTVNYSISIGLGFAGTINRYTSPGADGSINYLRGFRGAWWFGVGLDALGLLIATYFVWRTRPKNTKLMCLYTAVKDKRQSMRQEKQMEKVEAGEQDTRIHPSGRRTIWTSIANGGDARRQ